MPADQQPTRPSFTGNSLLLVRQPMPLSAIELLRRVSPPGTVSDDLILSFGSEWVARVPVPPPELRLRISEVFGIDVEALPIVVEPERYLYLNPLSTVPAFAEPEGEPMTWGVKAVGISGNEQPTGQGAVVAVLDSGIDLEHPDFCGRVDEDNVRPFVDHSAADDIGHGTHCAGIIAGPASPDSGRRYGVAPDVTLLVGDIYDPTGDRRSFDGALLAGLFWAAGRGAHVVSLSMGLPPEVHCQPHSTIINVIVEFLRDERDLIVVAAAGNSSDRKFDVVGAIEHPADCPAIVAVCAIDEHGQVSRTSSARVCDQRYPSVAAPGVGVYSARPVSFNKDDPYQRLSGTSQAAPHAAGVAALWVEKGYRGRILIDQLCASASAIPGARREDVGCGLVQAPPGPE